MSTAAQERTAKGKDRRAHFAQDLLRSDPDSRSMLHDAVQDVHTTWRVDEYRVRVAVWIC